MEVSNEFVQPWLIQTCDITHLPDPLILLTRIGSIGLNPVIENQRIYRMPAAQISHTRGNVAGEVGPVN